MHPLSMEGVRVSWLFGIGTFMMVVLGFWVVTQMPLKDPTEDGVFALLLSW